MRRIGLTVIVTLCFALVVYGVAGAQAVVRPARVGLLEAGSSSPMQRVFIERLRELGWVERQNLEIEIRRAEGKAEVLSALASDLVQRRVDVIVTSGTTAIGAARQVTETVPIVMAGGGDPVASGLVTSLRRPGGNITGVSLLGQELVPKGLSLLREIMPKAKRVDLLANAANHRRHTGGGYPGAGGSDVQSPRAAYRRRRHQAA